MSFYESSFLHGFVLTLLVHWHLLPGDCLPAPSEVCAGVGSGRVGCWRAGICTEKVAGGEEPGNHCEQSPAGYVSRNGGDLWLSGAVQESLSE